MEQKQSQSGEERLKEETARREKIMRRLEGTLQTLGFALEQRELQEAARQAEIEAAFQALNKRLETLETHLRGLLAATETEEESAQEVASEDAGLNEENPSTQPTTVSEDVEMEAVSVQGAPVAAFSERGE